MTGLNDNDNSFELEENVNFFDMFAQGKKEIEISDDPANDPLKGKGKEGEGTETDEEKAAAAEAQKKAELEKQQLAELMNGENTEDDDDDKGDGKKGKPGAKQKDGGVEASPELYKVLYSDFVEKGILADVGEDFDGTEESFIEAVTTTVVAGIEDGIKDEIASVFKDKEKGKVAYDFFNFMRLGGTVDEFQALRSHDGIDIKRLDDESEEVRVAEAQKALTKYYSSLNWSPEAIKRHVDRSKAKGVDAMIDEAKDVTVELQKSNAQKEKARTEELQNEKQKTVTATKQFNTEALSLIEKETEIAGFKLDKAMKQKLKEYMFVPTEEVGGKKLPKFAAERMKAAETDPRFLITQALYLMNGMKPDEKTAQTKATQSLTEKLKGIQKSNSATGSASRTGTGSQQTKQNANESTDFDFDPDKMEVVIL